MHIVLERFWGDRYRKYKRCREECMGNLRSMDDHLWDTHIHMYFSYLAIISCTCLYFVIVSDRKIER